MEASFMTTRRRVEILVDIVANQVSLKLPREQRKAFVEQAQKNVEVFFRTNLGKRIVAEDRNAPDELAAIEKAVFHITGRLRRWLNEHSAQEAGRGKK